MSKYSIYVHLFNNIGHYLFGLSTQIHVRNLCSNCVTESKVFDCANTSFWISLLSTVSTAPWRNFFYSIGDNLSVNRRLGYPIRLSISYIFPITSILPFAVAMKLVRTGYHLMHQTLNFHRIVELQLLFWTA